MFRPKKAYLLLRGILNQTAVDPGQPGQKSTAFNGVFASFAEACQAIPGTKPIGYYNHVPKVEADAPPGQLYLVDYPMLYWLKDLIATAHCVFDFGGRVGGCYYAYAKYLKYPEHFRWLVYEVATAVAKGEALAKERQAQHLAFTRLAGAADGADILLASGALQFLEAPYLSELLDNLAQKPRHLLINKAPVHDKRAFVTVHNVGSTLYPNQVFHRREFVGSLAARGYDLIDSWSTPESCLIPNHPECTVPNYSGFYFRRGPA